MISRTDPLQKLNNVPEETDQSGWPAWAKNQREGECSYNRGEEILQGRELYTKKTPFANTDVNSSLGSQEPYERLMTC